ncbi:MAG TPA: hypothetical protein DEP88_05510 [Verrucomicrobiales bacterium]|jgi:hypothetical protein|nr:hypothetical protein [Verrucomicrobiales bacterium]HCI90993.1 hypothetical protein [Verrucomicrobiales bacterium]HCL97336.1 hypothetical protein [Verrucomicrobiales bacterium]
MAREKEKMVRAKMARSPAVAVLTVALDMLQTHSGSPKTTQVLANMRDSSPMTSRARSQETYSRPVISNTIWIKQRSIHQRAAPHPAKVKEEIVSGKTPYSLTKRKP